MHSPLPSPIPQFSVQTPHLNAIVNWRILSNENFIRTNDSLKRATADKVKKPFSGLHNLKMARRNRRKKFSLKEMIFFSGGGEEGGGWVRREEYIHS